MRARRVFLFCACSVVQAFSQMEFQLMPGERGRRGGEREGRKGRGKRPICEALACRACVRARRVRGRSTWPSVRLPPEPQTLMFSRHDCAICCRFRHDMHGWDITTVRPS